MRKISFTISDVSTEKLHSSMTHQLVKDYLRHHGHASILKALDNKSKRSGKSCEISDKLVNLNERSSVNSLIVRGKAGAAKKRIFEHVQTDESHPTPAELGLVALYLSCQECVELIRRGRFQPQLITPRPPFALVSFATTFTKVSFEIGSHFLATRFLVKVQSAHF